MPRDTTFSLASAERYLTKWLDTKGEDHTDLEAALYVMHVLAGTVRTRERFANWLKRHKVARVAFGAYLVGRTGNGVPSLKRNTRGARRYSVT